MVTLGHTDATGGRVTYPYVRGPTGRASFLVSDDGRTFDVVRVTADSKDRIPGRTVSVRLRWVAESPPERPIEIDLGDGIRVGGRIDLIRRRSTNEVVVIDFKSNDRTQQEEVTDLQLRVYALGYEQATGERANEVVVDNLDDLANPRRSAVDAAMLDEATEAVRLAGEQLRSNSYPRSPRGADMPAKDTTCGRCDVVGICGGHRDGTDPN